MTEPTSVPERTRQAVAEAYESGWADALHEAMQALRHARNPQAALTRLEKLATAGPSPAATDTGRPTSRC